MAYDYIHKAYGLDFVPGDSVRHTVTCRVGRVSLERLSAGPYVQVVFDGDDHALSCHPKELENFGNDAPLEASVSTPSQMGGN